MLNYRRYSVIPAKTSNNGGSSASTNPFEADNNLATSPKAVTAADAASSDPKLDKELEKQRRKLDKELKARQKDAERKKEKEEKKRLKV